MEQAVDINDATRGLPPLWPGDVSALIRRQIEKRRDHKVVVLDDDPTGTQTAHGVWVVTRWTSEALEPVLTRDAPPCVYVLTNSRSLPEQDAAAATCEAVSNALRAAAITGVACDFISRSDSTLRGHFPAETDAIRAAVRDATGQDYDAIVLCPYFAEGGRVTIDDVHYVREGGQLVPTAATPFAEDVTFGYRSSDLRAWVEEKTAGRVRASEVASVTLGAIRREGPAGVTRALASMRRGRVVVINAADPQDLRVVVAGVLEAEVSGQRFLYRTAASFVGPYAGLGERGPLRPDELAGRDGDLGGLIVVGSYVPRTTRQLAPLLALPGIVPIEVAVSDVLGSRGQTIIRDLGDRVADGLKRSDVVVYTSRELHTEHGRAGDLGLAQQVSGALVEIVRQATSSGRPRFVLAKGGITSSDVATHALGCERARVVGPLLPGVSLWRLGPESRLPGAPYVVFPGNVGGDSAVADAVTLLRSGCAVPDRIARVEQP